MFIKLTGPGPLYQRIYRAIREQILCGHLPAGSQLPVTRELARELAVSRNVVLIAYEELVSEGYATSRVGAGTYVSNILPDVPVSRPRKSESLHATPPRRPSELSKYARRLMARANGGPTWARQPLQYDFDYGRVSPDDFPERLWRKLATKRLASPSLGYIDPAGDPRLRAGLALYLLNHRGVVAKPEQIIVVNGTLQALDLTTRLLIDAGDTVVMEDPHDPVARDVFVTGGAKIRAIAVDAEGLQVDRLPRDRGRIRLVHVTPSHQFPSGAILSLQRRLALLAWAERTGTYVFEDDYDSEFQYDARPIEALQGIDRGQRVIYVGTFSRLLFPALRLAYMVVPESLGQLFAQAKRLADRHSASWAQQVLGDFIQEGHLERHLRKCRLRKAESRAALLESVQGCFGDRAQIVGAASGVHALLRLYHCKAELIPELMVAAAKRGVAVYSAWPYYLQPPLTGELVMGYGALTASEIRAGIRILADALAGVLGSSEK